MVSRLFGLRLGFGLWRFKGLPLPIRELGQVHISIGEEQLGAALLLLLLDGVEEAEVLLVELGGELAAVTHVGVEPVVRQEGKFVGGSAESVLLTLADLAGVLDGAVLLEVVT